MREEGASRGLGEVAGTGRMTQAIRTPLFADLWRDKSIDQAVEREFAAAPAGANSGSLITRRWREMDSNLRSRHERAGFCCGRRIAEPSAGSQKGGFFCGTDGSNPSPSSRQSVSLPQPLLKVENPAFRAGLGSWLGDRVSRELAGGFDIASTGGNISVGPYSSTAVRLVVAPGLTRGRSVDL